MQRRSSGDVIIDDERSLFLLALNLPFSSGFSERKRDPQLKRGASLLDGRAPFVPMTEIVTT